MRKVNGEQPATAGALAAQHESRLIAWPEEGDVFGLPTPAGRRLYRVLKSNTFRVTLVPLSAAEAARVVQEIAAVELREARSWCLDNLATAITAAAAHALAGGRPPSFLRRWLARGLR